MKEGVIMKRFRSEAMQVIYEDAEHFYKAGLMTAEQFHEYDDCLLPSGREPARTHLTRQKKSPQHRPHSHSGINPR